MKLDYLLCNSEKTHFSKMLITPLILLLETSNLNRNERNKEALNSKNTYNFIIVPILQYIDFSVFFGLNMNTIEILKCHITS